MFILKLKCIRSGIVIKPSLTGKIWIRNIWFNIKCIIRYSRLTRLWSSTGDSNSVTKANTWLKFQDLSKNVIPTTNTHRKNFTKKILDMSLLLKYGKIKLWMCPKYWKIIEFSLGPIHRVVSNTSYLYVRVKFINGSY